MRWVLVGIIVLCNALSDILSTMGMKRHGEVEELRPRRILRITVNILRNPFVVGGLLVLAISFFALLGLLSIADVSFAIPATAIGYMLETLLARIVLKEQIHWIRWAGASLVACGVVLISL